MKKHLLILAVSLFVLQQTVQAQTNYSQTIGPFNSVYSSTPFTFTATPPTTGNGKLVFSWGACYQSGPASILRINLYTSTGLQQIVYTTSTLVCMGIQDSITIPGSLLSDAIQTGGGNVTGTLFITDYCQAGWGCSNFNDPAVFGMILSYTSHSANFSASSQAVCPGEQVQFTDQSINNPISWEWIFPGGTPSTSSQQNPVVTYAAPGSYDVTLITSDGSVVDTLTMPGYISIYTPPTVNAGFDSTICQGDSVMLNASGGVAYTWFPPLYISNDSIANPYVFPVNTTDYIVTATDANGCTGSDTVSVIVDPLPFIIVQAGNNPICLGDTTMIVAVGAQTYIWSPATGLNTTTGQSVFASPFNTTTYTITGTAFTGCVGTGTITITVNPLPPAPSITQFIDNLFSSPAAGYQWLLNGTPIPGANSQSYNFTQNGIYTVMISDSNGCESLSLPYNVTNTALNATMEETAVLISPNPTHALINITAGSEMESYEVTDQAGRKILHGKWPGSSKSVTIDISELSNGCYFLELRGSNKKSWHRIVRL